MREIKFRAWDKSINKMYKCIGFDEERVFIPNDKWIDPQTAILMQYTGLKDKAGCEIYEGDVLGSQKSKFKTLPVEMENGVNCGCCDDYRGWNLSIEDSKKYKIIGNIYENPELLS